MQTIQQFIAKNNLSMSCEWADRNPNMGDMPLGSAHYKCVLKTGRRQMTVYFSMGPAHTREPGIEEVLDCLASESAGVENARGFEDWCDEYGYDTDSRKAERTYKVCEAQARKLRQFLGGMEYGDLLFETERA